MQTRSMLTGTEYPAPVTCQSTACGEAAELGIRDEPPLLRPQGLDLREQLRPGLLGDVEPELLRLQPDRVEAALLAEHDRALGADELGGVRLDRGRVVELARDRTALAPEERVAGDRLPRLQRVARELADARRHLARPLE